MKNKENKCKWMFKYMILHLSTKCFPSKHVLYMDGLSHYCNSTQSKATAHAPISSKGTYLGLVLSMGLKQVIHLILAEPPTAEQRRYSSWKFYVHRLR